MRPIYTLAIVFLLFSSALMAQEKAIEDVDFDAFVEETNITSGGEDRIEIAWWLPQEFWAIVMANESSVKKEEGEQFVAALAPYNIFIVVAGDIGDLGEVKYDDPKKIEKYINVEGPNGEVLRPLDKKTLPVELQLLLSAFEPIMTNMVGDFGANMQYFVFDDLAADDERILDPMATDGSFKLNVQKNFTADFATPVPALLVEKVCPVDNEEYNGSWKYCPHHGDELEEATE